MDTKTLFHNPESLSEDELYQLRVKIQGQRRACFYGWTGGVLITFVMSQGVYRNQVFSLGKIFLGGMAGYVICANGVDRNSSLLKRDVDRDIVKAFDQRWLRSALSVSGLYTNHTSMGHNEDNNDFSKPY